MTVTSASTITKLDWNQPSVSRGRSLPFYRIAPCLRCFDTVFESALRQSSPCQFNVKFAVLVDFGLNFSVVYIDIVGILYFKGNLHCYTHLTLNCWEQKSKFHRFFLSSGKEVLGNAKLHVSIIYVRGIYFCMQQYEQPYHVI